MQSLRYSPYIKPLFGISDAIILVATIVFFNWGSWAWTEVSWLSIGILLLIWGLLSGKTKIYQVQRTLTYTKYLERLFLQLFFFIISLFFISKVNSHQSVDFFSWQIAVGFSLLILGTKSLVFFLIKWLRSKGINHRNIMFLGNSEGGVLLENRFRKRKDYGFQIFEFQGELSIENLQIFWQKKGIHRVYMPLKHSFSQDLVQQIFNSAERMGVRISIIPDVLLDRFSEYEISYAESQPILERTKFPLHFLGNSIVKRSFDIVFSLLFLLFIGSWLFPIIAVLIKMDDGGSIFFSQKRYGANDKIFHCLKFRTMKQNADCEKETTQIGDERITKIGHFLRKTSLDEMPQFINVLLGEMSVVGPRPHMLVVDDYYKQMIERYTIRSKVKPGITGLSQISGLRGEKENMNLEMQKRVLSDAFYVKNWSFSLDIVIILKTIFLLIKGDERAF